MESRNKQQTIRNFVLPLAFILVGALLRLVPHPANVAPIAAIALFGGVYLDKKYALIVPLIALLVSDVFLGFYSAMPFIYGSFLLTGIIGLWLRTHKTIPNIILASVVSSVLFYLITNFGFWLADDLYPKTFAGQMEAYGMALPFFRNTLIGDLFYTGLFFGSYAAMSNTFYAKKARLFKV